jgi:hypothetical protein
VVLFRSRTGSLDKLLLKSPVIELSKLAFKSLEMVIKAIKKPDSKALSDGFKKLKKQGSKFFLTAYYFCF